MKRRLLKGTLGTICALSIFIAGGESPDAARQFIWTLGWLCLAGITGILVGKLLKEDQDTIYDEEV